jgi:cytochrome c
MMRIFALSVVGFGAAVCMSSQAPSAAQGAPVNPAIKGKLIFLRCASCHAIGGNGGARIGPNLSGVVGRKAGSLPGATYSAAMKQQSFTWTEAALDRWLTQPSAVVPGTSMAFAGLPKPEDRAAVIAYLKNPEK